VEISAEEEEHEKTADESFNASMLKELKTQPVAEINDDEEKEVHEPIADESFNASMLKELKPIAEMTPEAENTVKTSPICKKRARISSDESDDSKPKVSSSNKKLSIFSDSDDDETEQISSPVSQQASMGPGSRHNLSHCRSPFPSSPIRRRCEAACLQRRR